ncbi:MAG: RNA ligase family protein [Planctomycetaceae bacterium]
MRTLAKLQSQCVELGVPVRTEGRPSKEPYIAALRQHIWDQQQPGQPMPKQIQPMLLADWQDLEDDTIRDLEGDQHAWIVQEKMDGVRAVLHVSENEVRITGRTTSEVTYRLSEYQANLQHLTKGLQSLDGTILDGEIVCPQSKINTGKTVTTSALQAAVAVLATSPENAALVQADSRTKLRFYVFDVLTMLGKDVSCLPLSDRLGLLTSIARQIDNSYITIVPSFSVNKAAIHQRIIDNGGEGTVWKKADEPYETGRRVEHWIKRKRNIRVEAFVSGYKLGTPGRGHRDLIGAVEFSYRDDGHEIPIAWVSAWTDDERRRMTTANAAGTPMLNQDYMGRRAIIVGQDESGRSKRLRHARIKHWMT